MGQTSNLRLKEVRAVFRLVGECRELGIDSALWRRHILTELVRLTGGTVAMGGPAAVRNGLLVPDPAPAVDLGWEGARERAIFAHFCATTCIGRTRPSRPLGHYLIRFICRSAP
jgi:hypothetical protein